MMQKQAHLGGQRHSAQLRVEPLEARCLLDARSLFPALTLSSSPSSGTVVTIADEPRVDRSTSPGQMEVQTTRETPTISVSTVIQERERPEETTPGPAFSENGLPTTDTGGVATGDTATPHAALPLRLLASTVAWSGSFLGISRDIPVEHLQTFFLIQGIRRQGDSSGSKNTPEQENPSLFDPGTAEKEAGTGGSSGSARPVAVALSGHNDVVLPRVGGHEPVPPSLALGGEAAVPPSLTVVRPNQVRGIDPEPGPLPRDRADLARGPGYLAWGMVLALGPLPSDGSAPTPLEKDSAADAVPMPTSETALEQETSNSGPDVSSAPQAASLLTDLVPFSITHIDLALQQFLGISRGEAGEVRNLLPWIGLSAWALGVAATGAMALRMRRAGTALPSAGWPVLFPEDGT
jgi:hypothetical protein